MMGMTEQLMVTPLRCAWERQDLAVEIVNRLTMDAERLSACSQK
jgi:hypothetical protein